MTGCIHLTQICTPSSFFAQVESRGGGGYVVIEDISRHSKKIWAVVSAVLPPQFVSALIETQNAYVFVVNRVK